MEDNFSDKKLVEELGRKQFHQQLAFGAACCERMLPAYEVFAAESGLGGGDLLRRMVDVAWEACEGAPILQTELAHLLLQSERFIPDLDDHTSLFAAFAQEAVLSVRALLCYMTEKETAHLVSIARFSTDSVDLAVQEQEEMDPRDQDLERRILVHPMMQRELRRQRRDLAETSRIALGDVSAIRLIRDRAQRESLLGDPDSS